MHLLESLSRLLTRFRYPVSLPEDIAQDLGMNLPSSMSFEEFLEVLASPHHRPTKIHRKMERAMAERAFEAALRKEQFHSCSMYSYYFNGGWLVFSLYYDEEALLTRAYVQCPICCEEGEGFDLPLEEAADLIVSV